MKRKWFFMAKLASQYCTVGAIAVMAMVGMFVFENTAAAHEISQSKKESRNVGRSRIARLVNPVSALNQSWIDLTFGVKADPETLAKALPIYQETREALQKQIKEAHTAADSRREAAKKISEGVKETYTKFNASLKEILTEEQMTKLTELKKKRHAAAKERAKQYRRSQREEHSHRRHHHSHRRHH